MLKNFKIGTKLMWGFALLSLIILLVGIAGYICLGLVATEVKYMNDLADINRQANDMVSQSYSAQIASALYTLTKDPKEVKNLDENVDKILANIEPLSKRILANDRADNKISAEVANIKKEAELYKAEQHKYVDLYAKSTKAAEIRLAAANSAVKATRDLIALIDKVTLENAKKDGDAVFVPQARFEQIQETALLLEQAEKIRRLNRDVDLNITDVEKRDGFKNEAMGIFPVVTDSLKKIKGGLTTDEGRRLVDVAVTGMETWKSALVDDIQTSVDMVHCDEVSAEIALRFGKAANTTLDLLRGDMADCEKIVADIDNSASYGIIFAILCGVIVGTILGLVLRSDITTGIKGVTSLMNSVAGEGDISVRIPEEFLSRKDETGDLAKAAGMVLRDYQSVSGMADSLSHGDWTVQIKPKTDKDSMNIGLKNMIAAVNDALRQVNTAVSQVAVGSGEVSTASQALSSGAQESAASLEQITASMSDISSQTKTNAESAGNARDLAQKATQAASEGQQAMRDMNVSMERITKNSEEVQRVIKVIDDIAFQTNLLALNAAVEAARAGQHGKGFAVVAEEVRNLAARSAKAAQETAELIATSGKEIEKGGEVSSHTSEVLNTIVDQIKQTTDLVAGIAVASNEQAQGVNQVTIGLQQIDAVTQQNTASAEESASAANEMSGQATQLQALIARFKLA